MSAALDRLFVYQPELGGEMDAEKKILFFHPAGTPLGEQVRLVGLSEALANFAISFGAASDCEAMHTQNRRHVFLQAEKNLWFVLVARNPPSTSPPLRRESSGSGGMGSPDPRSPQGSLSEPSERAGEEAGDNEAELQDTHLTAVLRRIYGTLRMFCGPLLEVLARRGAPALR